MNGVKTTSVHLIIPNADVTSPIRSFGEHAVQEMHFSSLFLTQEEGLPGKKGFTKEPRKEVEFKQFICRATFAFNTKKQFTALLNDILAIFMQETDNKHICLHTLKTAVLDPVKLPIPNTKRPRLILTMRNEDAFTPTVFLGERSKRGGQKSDTSSIIPDEGWKDVRIMLIGLAGTDIAQMVAHFFSENDTLVDDRVAIISVGTI